MFRCAKPFGQALRPEPAGVLPAAYGGFHGRGCTPRPREGYALPATAWTASGGTPPYC